MKSKPLAIMGVFAVDLAFRVNRLPVWGETVLGSEFRLGPGGKGSNQSVAAARLGAEVYFVSKVGTDNFAEIARRTYEEEGVETEFLFTSDKHTTGAAAIIIDELKGENAIVITPGAANALSTHEIDRARACISRSAVFMTQLELPLPIVVHGLMSARELGVPTILNPAPACVLDNATLALCDYLTPNESEAEALTGLRVETLQDAEKAADQLLSRGVRNVLLTLGARGVLVKNSSLTMHIEAFDAGQVIDTTGAGDAFNAGLAVALSEKMSLEEAARFGCVVAGISVTRHGTAPSMPRRSELEDYKAASSTKNS